MKRFATVLACLAALGTAPAAWATQTFTVSGVAVRGDDVTITAPTGPEGTTAGPITLTTSLGTLAAWCVDLYHVVYLGTGQNLHYQVGNVTTDGAAQPNTLTTAQLTTIAQLAQYGQSLVASSTASTDQLAAVQLAIWSTEYTSFTYTGGTGADVTGALAAARSFRAVDTGLIALDGTQTFVTASPLFIGTSQAATPVPEPAGLALMCLALPALAAVRRARSAA